MTATISEDQVRAFEHSIASEAIALFPTDTVYGLACNPESEWAVNRMYQIKQRPVERAAAVLFFTLEQALERIEAGPRTAAALERLLPARVTVLIPNRHGLFPLACGSQPSRLGMRVPELTGALSPLRAVEHPVLQSSANLSGGIEARRLQDVDAEVRRSVDFELDGGELPGTASTVVDLTRYESDRSYAIVRCGAVSHAQLAGVL